VFATASEGNVGGLSSNSNNTGSNDINASGNTSSNASGNIAGAGTGSSRAKDMNAGPDRTASSKVAKAAAAAPAMVSAAPMQPAVSNKKLAAVGNASGIMANNGSSNAGSITSNGPGSATIAGNGAVGSSSSLKSKLRSKTDRVRLVPCDVTANRERAKLLLKIERILYGLESLLLFQEVFEDDALCKLCDILRMLLHWRSPLDPSIMLPMESTGDMMALNNAESNKIRNTSDNLNTDGIFTSSEIIAEVEAMQMRLEASLYEAYGSYFRAYSSVGAKSWRDHVINCVLYDDNPFTVQCQCCPDDFVWADLNAPAADPSAFLDSDMLGAVRNDLERLEALVEITPRRLSEWIYQITGCRTLCLSADDGSPSMLKSKAAILADDSSATWARGNQSLREFASQRQSRPKADVPAQEQLDRGVFPEDANWAGCVTRLAQFHAKRGSGELARGQYFRYLPEERQLVHVDDAAIQHFPVESFVGLEREMEMLSRNLQFLLHGLPAQNVLISGPHGMGKSAMLKAAVSDLNSRDGGNRLKLIELSSLYDLAEMRHMLQHDLMVSTRKSLKFIFFVEHLFIEDYDQMRAVLATLDGGAGQLPRNSIVVAMTRDPNPDSGSTMGVSTMSMMYGDDDEGGREFEMMEDEDTLALKERFGLQLTLPAPSRERYLSLVKELRERRNVQIPDDVLEMRASRYAKERKSFSSRVASQFIDYLHSEQALFRWNKFEKSELENRRNRRSKANASSELTEEERLRASTLKLEVSEHGNGQGVPQSELLSSSDSNQTESETNTRKDISMSDDDVDLLE